MSTKSVSLLSVAMVKNVAKSNLGRKEPSVTEGSQGRIEFILTYVSVYGRVHVCVGTCGGQRCAVPLNYRLLLTPSLQMAVESQTWVLHKGSKHL